MKLLSLLKSMSVMLAVAIGVSLAAGIARAEVNIAPAPTSCSDPEVRSIFSESVRIMYGNLLHRKPDDGGWQYWIGQACAGVPLQDINLAFVNSPEFACDIKVLHLYESCLGREPEGVPGNFWNPGPIGWVGLCSAGVPDSTLKAGFLSSGECASKPGICQAQTCHS